MKVTTLDIKARKIKTLENQEELSFTLKVSITRIAPYLPNFNNIPANTIEPLVLASTWAFGNQKWNPNIGILIKKGTNSNSAIPLILQEELEVNPNMPVLSIKRIKVK